MQQYWASGLRINENFVSIPSFQGKALVLAPESLKQQQQQHDVGSCSSRPVWPGHWTLDRHSTPVDTLVLDHPSLVNTQPRYNKKGNVLHLITSQS